jgi:hypothetical protein
MYGLVTAEEQQRLLERFEGRWMEGLGGRFGVM